jgi:hypothetical protein
VLVEHGADYKAVNNDGETAEQAARQHGKTAAAEVLAAWAKDPKCEVVACCHEVFIVPLRKRGNCLVFQALILLAAFSLSYTRASH